MAHNLGPASTDPTLVETPDDTSGAERRGSGRRARARDRLMDRANVVYQPNPALTEALTKSRDVENLLLFIDDDLRETALAMERIERYLLATMGILDGESFDRGHIHELATDASVLEHVDSLNETLESLRRRMARLARMV